MLKRRDPRGPGPPLINPLLVMLFLELSSVSSQNPFVIVDQKNPDAIVETSEKLFQFTQERHH